ncbi:MAG: NADH-quinone oxidoreductase subunit L [Verrucomicrobiota bacterium]|nr:NADH-quinone oxidoreductase subunit L [Limisphaera sp.]MDW8381318.1 NADH-quinone oxidoreductase subunit L [Verrucomicrobiota bacterium]
METWVQWMWLIPVLPMVAAGVSGLLPRTARGWSAGLSIGSLALSFVLSVISFAAVWQSGGERHLYGFRWFQFGPGAFGTLWLSWVLDPLSASMLVMVSGVGLLIFIYSLGYMAHDANFTRFFCFLSLFAGAMLGLVMSNSLVGLFMCWELVGLASYLLIGFWFQKPAAAAAAKKAFITTRVGDLVFFLGLVWLFGNSGTQLFYDNGSGCLEAATLNALVQQKVWWDWSLSQVIGLLLFAGAVGKSGQLPLHVWLPDAMEGPTPVSALIHAATMVAAGVFLMARVYPLLVAGPEGVVQPVLMVMAWVGGLTAVFAAAVAVAQDDIKRILAYSTISQLGYMMLGLATGGVAVGVFHLLTHACFKALLFLGAGSVIHACSEEQNIWRLGGLRRWMPVTYVTYGVGMLALTGFPVLFSGFWSKEAILHATHAWPVSAGPFWLGLAGVFLTAFYMTRQMVLVFGGTPRGNVTSGSIHESPPVMTVPLIVLASLSVVTGFVGTPAWPWLQGFLEGQQAILDWSRLFGADVWGLAAISCAAVFLGMGVGLVLYRRIAAEGVIQRDPLEQLPAGLCPALRKKFWVDEAYQHSVVPALAWLAYWCDRMDRWVWAGLMRLAACVTLVVARLSQNVDEAVVNAGFDRACEGLRLQGGRLSLWQNGQVQRYLAFVGAAMAILVSLWWWGGNR